MGALFGVLILLSFVSLILGLIKPSLVLHWGKRRTRGRSTLTYIGAIILFSILAGVTSGGAAKSAIATTDNTSNTTASAPSTASAAKTTTTATATSTPLPKIGQSVSVGSLTYTVNSATYEKTLNDGGTGFAPSANGGEWLVLDISIKNDDTKARTINDTMFNVLLGSTKYSASSDADIAINSQNSSSFFLNQLNPGLSAHGLVAFNVPQSGNYTLDVESGMFGGSSASIQLTK